MGDLTRHDVLSFDCYGTLIDWDTGIGDRLAGWAAAVGLSVEREVLLARFAATETVVQGSYDPALPYPEVLAETLRRIGAGLGVTVDADHAKAFGASVPDWPPFDDAKDALRRLADRFRLVIVSNVDRTSFRGSADRLGVGFDAVITAEDVGSYKPRDGHFAALFDQLARWGVPRQRLLHVAESLYHDHEPARRHGIDSVWIHRRAGMEGTGATAPPTDPSVTPRWRFESMRSFADAILAGP